MRAYRELEIRSVLDTQQGTGTFITQKKVKQNDVERRRLLAQLVDEFVARAGSAGFTTEDLLEQLRDLSSDRGRAESNMTEYQRSNLRFRRGGAGLCPACPAR